VKRPPIIRAFLGDEVICDNFAGGGGASTGIELALGRSPDLAINHDAEAIAMHAANHPTTDHRIENVWEVDPIEACRGKAVALAWFSPDCKHHSKAKGGKPREQKIRGLAWVAVRWAQAVKPRVIALENVEEFRDWGPLDRATGMPIKSRKGQTFRAFVRKLERLGYVVEHQLLRACDYGAPTTRRRLFLIARCDGRRIVWPTATHGRGRSQPHRTAAECIDWSIACPSIFERDRPLADKTLARIARGIRKYVLESARPFVIPVNHGGIGRTDHRVHGIDEPLPTITGGQRGGHAVVSPMLVKAKTHGGGGNDAMPADEPLRTITASKRGEFALVAPVLVPQTHGDGKSGPDTRTHDVNEPFRTITAIGAQFSIAVPYLVHRSNGERIGQAPRIYDINEPLRTIVAKGEKHAVCAAFLAKHYGERDTGGWNGGAQVDLPFGAVTARDHHSLVAANLVKFQQNGSGVGLEEPMHTVMAGASRFALVASFLSRYNGQSIGQQIDLPISTVDTRDRFGLVTVAIDGEEYVIVDIGMRMLTPRELFRAQGFGDEYIVDPVHNGKPLTKTAQIRMCGNSVCPPLAAAIVRAQFPEAA